MDTENYSAAPRARTLDAMRHGDITYLNSHHEISNAERDRRDAYRTERFYGNLGRTRSKR